MSKQELIHEIDLVREQLRTLALLKYTSPTGLWAVVRQLGEIQDKIASSEDLE